jgi:hypothetical protein
MGLTSVQYVTCDRCGRSEQAGGQLGGVASGVVSQHEFGEACPGWRMVDGGRTLCPACADGYDLLLARHRVELEDYVTGGGRGDA